MFTYVNSNKSQMFFNVEIQKASMIPLKNHPSLRKLKITFVQKDVAAQHKVFVGLYNQACLEDLLKGMSTINEWAKSEQYITLGAIRERLEKTYNCHEENIPSDVSLDDM